MTAVRMMIVLRTDTLAKLRGSAPVIACRGEIYPPGSLAKWPSRGPSCAKEVHRKYLGPKTPVNLLLTVGVALPVMQKTLLW
jgi:hypothetical protein